MPRKSAADKKVEEKAEVKANLEEIPPSETSEIKSENSTSEVTENFVETTSKKRFGYKWVLLALGLILVVLFFIYFDNIQYLFLNYESRFYVGGGLFTALIIGLLVWYIPKSQVKKLAKQSSEEKLTDFEREEKRLKLEDDTRKTLAQIVGGVFLIAGLFVTYNTYRLGTDNYRLGLEQQKINSRGQITDRFNKAITNLGSQDLSVRLGGLYALEQILKDSPEEHQTIIEVLSAYVREKSKITEGSQKKLTQSNVVESKDEQNYFVPTDVLTALTILGRRPTGNERKQTKISLGNVKLSKASLSGADFSGAILNDADLSETDFTRANLSYAILRRTDLRFISLARADLSEANLIEAILNESNLSGATFNGAYLSHASLISANLIEANLIGANFYRANLSQASLSRANLSHADLSEANLSLTRFNEANLNEANLYNVSGLTAKQLERAIFDSIYLDKQKLDRESALKYFREKETENNKE